MITTNSWKMFRKKLQFQRKLFDKQLGKEKGELDIYLRIL